MFQVAARICEDAAFLWLHAVKWPGGAENMNQYAAWLLRDAASLRLCAAKCGMVAAPGSISAAKWISRAANGPDQEIRPVGRAAYCPGFAARPAGFKGAVGLW
ncbi:MAG: hypothetical protein ACJ76J_15670 [Thermoanaerobaculia bacterium]